MSKKSASIKITKFRGVHRGGVSRKSHAGVVTVLRNETEREITLPVYAAGAESAASAARRWRNIPGNMERLISAFDDGLDYVPTIKP